MARPNAPAHRPPNRLAGSASPYLLQHALNPVDWYPWGQDAIARARAEDRPLFVSIGYATCYWCHVMERESFENQATAEVLNRLYVPVKVDREMRPDVDDVYMAACQVFTRWTDGRSSGGWPLSIFVEPRTLRPFYVGTYFPPEPSYGRPSFRQVLEGLATAWRTRREEVEAQAERLAEAVTEQLSVAAAPSRRLDPTIIDVAAAVLLRVADREHGGFGGAPKFPQPVYLDLLERRIHEPRIAEDVTRTLDAMAIGGIFDHLTGGFHRYAVDATWTVPHFEKMLYDNAQLARLYARSFRRSGDTFHAEVARRTCDFVLRSMRDPRGGFHAAIDAEVDAREGKNYLWTREEVLDALRVAGRDDLAPLAAAIFGLDSPPNFQDPHHRDEPPGFVLRLGARPERVAESLGLERGAFEKDRRDMAEILLAVRDRRPQPTTDTKRLVAWNGLMIAALAECGVLLSDDSYVAAAGEALAAIEADAASSDGGLLRVAASRIDETPGFLEDYAFLAHAHLALARALGGRRAVEHRTRAAALVADADTRFAAEDGGWFDVEASQSDLFVRARSMHDGAVPSGTSVMLHVLLDLLAIDASEARRARLARAFEACAATLADETVSAALGAVALDRALVEAPEVVAAVRPALSTSMSFEELRVAGDSVVGTLVIHAPGLHIDAAGTDAVVFVAIDPREVQLSFEVSPGGAGRVPFVATGAGLADAATLTVDVTVRLCDDRACYPPRTERVSGTIRRP